jgi:putative transcriptional regulator
MKDMGEKQTAGEGNPAGVSGDDSSFRNMLLVAMPTQHGGAFSKSVVYLCAHGGEGAMGLVINRPLEGVAFDELLSQLELPQSQLGVQPVVHFGGPVEVGRGFVLHSNDFMREDTIRVEGGICITGTIDILRAMAEGTGPSKSIFALGYAGWGPGQLEAEMQANSWLIVPADDELVFSADIGNKWEKALNRLGIDPLSLSLDGGRA